jgi:hypothetical protein
MTWDVTVTDTLADSYLATTSLVAGSAAEGAANRNELKFHCLEPPTHSPTRLLRWHSRRSAPSTRRVFLFSVGWVVASPYFQATSERQRFYISVCPSQFKDSTLFVSKAAFHGKQTPTPNHSDTNCFQLFSVFSPRGLYYRGQ